MLVEVTPEFFELLISMSDNHAYLAPAFNRAMGRRGKVKDKDAGAYRQFIFDTVVRKQRPSEFVPQPGWSIEKAIAEPAHDN